MKLYEYKKLTISNTLTREKETFVPIENKDFVGLYSCGPTVYSHPHIGNYRASFTADLIRNVLKLLGYNVKAVMNITDVGHLSGDNEGDADHGQDKLEKSAKKEGVTAWDIACKYESIFMDELHILHIDRFDVMPRATEHIAEQIAMVQELERKGYTYRIEGDGIYMDTSKVENYGKLMGPNYKKRLAGLKQGARVEAYEKKHPSDFALWKFSSPEEKRHMERESPRGVGFPGWHIECSAMSSKYLGNTFDIHHGGSEHISIHHTNEIAQSECCFGQKPRVKYRIHHGFLTVGGSKMSKSLGNTYTLVDIQQRGFSPLDLRMFYLQAHYKSEQDFTREILEAAKKARENIQEKIRKYTCTRKNVRQNDYLVELETQEHLVRFVQNNAFAQKCIHALCDDFNTPKLLATINTMVKNPKEEDVIFLEYLDQKVLKLDLFVMPKNYGENLDVPQEIVCLANQRLEAKKQKDRLEADRIRNQIESKGYVVMDTKDGYELKKK